MKRVLAILLGGVTLVLIIMGWFQSGGAEAHGLQSASTPEQAVRLMLSQIRSHDFGLVPDVTRYFAGTAQ